MAKKPNYTEEQLKHIKNFREQIPDIFNGAFRKKYDKAMEGNSMRAGVDAKCADCMNWQSREVHACDLVNCSLWPYRPKSRTKSVEPMA